MMPGIRRVALGHYGLAALSGGLLAMSYAMHPFWWAAWLAPAPVIVATLRAPVASRRRLSLLTGVIGGISSFSYHLTVGGWLAALLILALVTVAWSSAIRLAVTFAERRSFLPAVLAVPVTWAAIDTLLIHFSPHGSAGSIAYSQMNALPVIQVASLGGVPAVTFVVLLAGSLLGVLLARTPDVDRRGLRATSVLAAAAVGACLLFGVMRLHHATTAPGAKLALIATDGIRTQPRRWDAFWKSYGREITRVIGPDTIVLLPEAVVRLPAAAAEQAGRSLAAHAMQHRSTIVVGIIVDEAGRLTNRALIAQPDGSYRWYLKQYLVPGVEAGITPGTSPVVLRDPTTGIGVAICKDMHFPTLGRDYARKDARLMLVPANDFDVDDWLTARMTVLRGVESGSSIARAARHGISFVSDRYGRVIAERRSDSTMGTLLARAPADPGDATYYALFGDVFGWVCALVWAILLAFRTGRFSKQVARNGFRELDRISNS
ncbi:nitrilase-related carbon-nitrogen hydrolase [Sphingomonas arantia]|uniref:Nitrilase-related carbon-nitrogen hydrolase n=1 Tax=Sphingomonas arantia TaxID=1460676 RepID=A0ABW4TZ60_9SPHN